jgi:ketosteroid isomerase-like protein
VSATGEAGAAAPSESPDAATQAAAADFVRRFADFWKWPNPERLDTVLAPDAHLVAPMVPVADSLAEGQVAFEELFELIPDLTAEVHRWGATVDGVMIEFTLSGTAGGKPLSWTSVDRFTLREDGLATERMTYFDSAPLALSLARSPKAWPGFIRSRLRQRRR